MFPLTVSFICPPSQQTTFSAQRYLPAPVIIGLVAALSSHEDTETHRQHTDQCQMWTDALRDVKITCSLTLTSEPESLFSPMDISVALFKSEWKCALFVCHYFCYEPLCVCSYLAAPINLAELMQSCQNIEVECLSIKFTFLIHNRIMHSKALLQIK